jgi:hypothetical protein
VCECIMPRREEMKFEWMKNIMRTFRLSVMLNEEMDGPRATDKK